MGVVFAPYGSSPQKNVGEFNSMNTSNWFQLFFEVFQLLSHEIDNCMVMQKIVDYDFLPTDVHVLNKTILIGNNTK